MFQCDLHDLIKKELEKTDEIHELEIQITHKKDTHSAHTLCGLPTLDIEIKIERLWTDVTCLSCINNKNKKIKKTKRQVFKPLPVEIVNNIKINNLSPVADINNPITQEKLRKYWNNNSDPINELEKFATVD